jgi:tRNA 2-thiocytidine biosynthesis protein TtcA
MKELLKQWGKSHPGRVESMFRALTHVVPSHLLDAQLFNFKELVVGDAPLDGIGDLAIDEGLDEACSSEELIQSVKFY